MYGRRDQTKPKQRNDVTCDRAECKLQQLSLIFFSFLLQPLSLLISLTGLIWSSLRPLLPVWSAHLEFVWNSLKTLVELCSFPTWIMVWPRLRASGLQQQQVNYKNSENAKQQWHAAIDLFQRSPLTFSSVNLVLFLPPSAPLSSPCPLLSSLSCTGGCVNFPSWRANPQYLLQVENDGNFQVQLETQFEQNNVQHIGFLVVRTKGKHKEGRKRDTARRRRRTERGQKRKSEKGCERRHVHASLDVFVFFCPTDVDCKKLVLSASDVVADCKFANKQSGTSQSCHTVSRVTRPLACLRPRQCTLTCHGSLRTT